MSGARWIVCEMDGGKWMAWDEGDEWCIVVRDEWWGSSGERWMWWEMKMNVYIKRRYVGGVRGIVWDICVWLCVYVRCCVRWMRWVVWNDGERWVMSDKWIKINDNRMTSTNTLYTQQGAAAAYQENITAFFFFCCIRSPQLPKLA